jgi:hypothetical protein
MSSIDVQGVLERKRVMKYQTQMQNRSGRTLTAYNSGKGNGAEANGMV